MPVEVDIQDKRCAPRIRVSAAYNQGCLQAPLRFEYSTDPRVSNAWVEHCLIPVLPPSQVVILDHATFHQSPHTQRLIEAAVAKDEALWHQFQPTRADQLATQLPEADWVQLSCGEGATAPLAAIQGCLSCLTGATQSVRW